MKNDALGFMEELVGPTTVGRLLRNYRYRNDVDQRTLADKLDVTVGFISNIETGKKNLSLEKTLEVCRKLNQSEKFWMVVYFEEEARRAGKKIKITVDDLKPTKRA